MRFSFRTMALALVLMTLAVWSPAQEITGTITGIVTDSSGAVVPGATVTVKNTNTGLVREFTTTGTGRYTASFLPVGSYELTISLAGFKPYAAKGIAVHVNDRLEINAQLGVQGMEDVVEVSAAAQLIQPTPAVQTLMGPTQVQELPLNNRNFVQLATLVPGVNSSLPDEVGIGLTNVVSVSIAGARRNAVNWLVDGASNVDVGSNVTLLSTPTLESIEEFKILTSSYAAEWPRSGGGVVNVVTKSGSNVWRASAYEFLRNDALNANGFFRKQQGCTATGCSTTPGDVLVRENPPELDYHNFGYTLGGPIKRNQLFFFFSQEWRQISRAPADTVATVIDPAWLNDPANPNYVAPALRDANAVRLLQAWPQPNTGNQFRDTRPNKQDTRQEVVRLDWQPNAKWRLMARYTHDLSMTTEPGGLFFGTPIPGIAGTNTDVPGHVAVAQVTTILSPRLVNEASFQFSGNAIKSEYVEGTRNKRSDYGLTIPEIYAENRNSLIPTVAITGISSIGAPQLFDNKYRNYTFADNVSYQRGNHHWKGGLLLAFEQKDELSGSATQGSFSFGAGGGRTAFQNFITGNAGGLCGASCSYTEPTMEIGSQFRFNRYEFFLQDSWRVKPELTIDLGVRYSLFPSPTDENNLLTNFVPSLWSPSRVGTFNAAATAINVGTGDPTNGIIQAGVNSPYGDAIFKTDKNNIQPRIGFSWDLGKKGETVLRGGYGIYYDQVLIGIFLQNAFVNPPIVTSPQILNAQLSNPAAGTSPTTRPVVNLIASSDPFITPRTQQWNVGVQRKLYKRGVIDVGYVGSAGDNLIQPVDINQAQPADVVRLNGLLNLARPYPGYGSINFRQTTAKARYHGLLVGFRHDHGRAGTFSIAYTLSRTKTDATNDRDALDLPQNPLDLGAEYAIARTDRTHVFTANYVYELPFFKEAKGLTRAVLGGWQVSGITQFWSGPPISRVINGTTNGGRRGIRVNQVGDPFANVPASVPGGVYWFNPAAFESPADGAYGNTGRAIFRLPGVNQWDITLSKNWYPSGSTRLQFRADFINAFNHTQLDPGGIQNVCSAALTNPTCAIGGTNRFGQITSARSAREIQLGLRFSWN